MNNTSWATFEDFLAQNEYDFTHVETEKEYLEEVESIKEENEEIIKFIEGKESNAKCCRRYRPVRRRVCRWVRYGNRRQYECTTHTYYECIQRC